MATSFSRYAAIVKNLRGVVLVDPGEERSLRFLRWLSNRFRYRNVGTSPSVHESLKLRGKVLRPIINLYYPVREVRDLIEYLASGLGTYTREVIESVILASTYVSPVIVFGERFRGSLRSASINTIKTSVKMNNKSLKLHLRIADYSILDTYLANLRLLEGLWTGTAPEDVIKRRREVAVNEGRRFWRLTKSKGEAPEEEVVYYVDMVKAANDAGLVNELTKRFKYEDVGAALTIVPVVAVPSYMIG